MLFLMPRRGRPAQGASAAHRRHPCRRLAGWFIVGSGLLASTSAHAGQPYADMPGAGWAAACVSCHGAAAPVKGSTIPVLAGMPASRIINKMKAYAAADAPGSLMPQIARGYDAQTMVAIAQWYSRLVPLTP